MAIPVVQGSSWAELDASGKRAKLLAAAAEVFARSGMEAPMPEVAAAAGAGVGSVYRQFPSKHELVAALVVERLVEAREDAEAAVVSPEGPWAALAALLRGYAERQADDYVFAEALGYVSTDPDVDRAYVAKVVAWERLLEAGREEGRLRPDATTEDLRLLLAATRAAGQLGAGAWERMLELGIDALDTRAASDRLSVPLASPA
jgi:AcrR family transcriptional regulator